MSQILTLCLLALAVSNVDGVAAPMDKVYGLLTDLKAKVNAGGEEEALTYNKFACFCRDNLEALTARLDQQAEQKDNVQAEINNQVSLRDADDQLIQQKTQSVSETEAEIKNMESLHHNQTLQNNKEEVDLTGAIASLESAIQMMKATRASVGGAALVQVFRPVAQEISQALEMVESMGDDLSLSKKDDKVLTSLLLTKQDPLSTDLTDTYQFHSHDIIDTLENLKRDFRDKKTELQGSWLQTTQEFESLRQNKKQLITAETSSTEEAQGRKALETAAIQTYTADFSTVSSEYAKDAAFLEELRTKCHEKAVVYDQRTTTRANEITALQTAMDLIGDVQVPSASAALVQRRPTSMLQVSIQRHALDKPVDAPAQPVPATKPAASGKLDLSRRSRIVALLKGFATKLNSAALLNVVEAAEQDPFAKIKTIVQELTERLIKEQQEATTHKGWCDGEMLTAKQTRDFKAKQVAETNSKLAVTEARIQELTQLLAQTEIDMTTLRATLNETQTYRAQETAENAASIEEATQAKDAVDQALAVIKNFYRSALIQTGSKQTPAAATTTGQAIPDAGFSGEYQGAQGDGAGIISMLDVMKHSFEKTIIETKTAEEDAKQSAAELSAQTEVTLAAKEASVDAYTSSRAATDAEDQDLRVKLSEYQATLEKSLEELDALDRTCNKGGMTAEEIKAKREEEMEALQKALCILNAHEEGTIDAC